LKRNYRNTELKQKISAAVEQILAAGGSRKKITAILAELTTESEARRILTDDGVRPMILWVPEDLRSLRPQWPLSKCEEALIDIRRRLEDRSVELGWNVMGDLLGMWESDKKKPRTKARK